MNIRQVNSNTSGVRTDRQKKYIANPWRNEILCGDCVHLMRQMPDNSVDAVITSPPYFQQRDYRAGGIGQEENMDSYIEALLNAFGEIFRITKPTGNIIYNLGDKYKNGKLLLVPFRFALAVTESFPVFLVNNITWVKSNPTPRQYKRRLVSSTEPFFHFAKSADYYYDYHKFMMSDEENKQLKLTLKSRQETKIGERYKHLIDRSSLTEHQKQIAHNELEKVIDEVREGKLHSFRMKILGVHAPAFGGQNGGRKSQMERDGFTIIRIRGEKMKKDILMNAVAKSNGSNHSAVYPLSIICELIKLTCPQGDSSWILMLVAELPHLRQNSKIVILLVWILMRIIVAMLEKYSVVNER